MTAKADQHDLYPRGDQPTRVLRPVLAPKATIGLVDHPQADQHDLYPRSVQPARVLRPPLALMARLVDHPQAEEVGR